MQATSGALQAGNGEPPCQDTPENNKGPKVVNHISGVLEAINSNQVQKVGNTLVLPSGCTWPGSTNNILYVRECYAPLFDHVLDRCRPHRSWTDHRYIVTGQPGIAKSDLGSYIMYRLLTEQDRPSLRIIYMSRILRARGLAAVIHKTPEGCRVSAETLLDATPIEDDKTVMICDKVLPVDFHCAVVWISSPAALLVEHSKEERKTVLTGRVQLPLPTVGELLDMNNSTFRSMGLTEEDVQVRAALWGPVPRLVFSDDVVYLENLLLSVRSMPPPQLLAVFDCVNRHGWCETNPNHVVLLERAAGQNEGSDADRLSRMRHANYYLRGRTVVASEAFSAWILSAIQILPNLKEIDRIFVSIGLTERSAKCAAVFSQLALRVLETGGTFSVGDLASKAVGSWRLPRLKPIPGHSDADQLRPPSPRMAPAGRPSTKLPAGLDGYNFRFYTPTRFSYSKSPGIDDKEFAEDLSLLGGKGGASKAGWRMSPTLQGPNATSESSTIHMCVIPEDHFDEWQLEKRPKGRSQRSGAVQYVLSMPNDMLCTAVEATTGEKLLLAAFDEVRQSCVRAADSQRAGRGRASSYPGG